MNQKSAISIRNIWKIFGERHKEAYQAILHSGVSKKEALERYNCVIGVADVSFEVDPGQIYCVMGLSGSGKSTLVRHINRLLEPTSGSILVNGQNIMELDQKSLQAFRNQYIAMVFQNFALLPHRSVLENIAMPLDIRGVPKNQRLKKAEECLELVELNGWGNKFAHELSGGMQQRIGLARALASDPKVLLMDEPFSALDPLIRRQLQSQFMRLASKMNKTTVFITHDLDEAVRIGDRIAIMRDGRIVQKGTAEDIIMNPADSYVADFVSGISRLKIVHAQAIMQNIDAFTSEHGPLNDNLPRFKKSDPLNILIKGSLVQDKPLVICNESGEKVGIITHQDLLKTILEETEAE